MISAVYEDSQGVRYEARYGDKQSFRRALRSLAKRTGEVFLHAVDYKEGIAVRPSNLWGYLRS